MQIGTWNLDGRWKVDHSELLQDTGCEVWMLTEVSKKAIKQPGIIGKYHCHHTKGEMASDRYWAAILSLEPLSPLLPDPHPASAAAIINRVTYCSSILPWAGCKTHPPTPWIGDNLADMTQDAIQSLLKVLPKSGLVWGGDWNQNLAGGWENVGSHARREYLSSVLASLGLGVPTAGLLHQLENGCHSIDHIAVPSKWKVNGTKRVSAKGLSDHDAYVVEVVPA